MSTIAQPQRKGAHWLVRPDDKTPSERAPHTGRRWATASSSGLPLSRAASNWLRLPVHMSAIPPCEGLHVLFGGRFLLCDCGSRFELAWPPTRLLGGRAWTSESVLVRATGADTARSPRPRLPHVRYRGTRALFGGVPRKGRESRLAAFAQASSRIANRARSSCSTEVRRERRTPMGSGRCVPAR